MPSFLGRPQLAASAFLLRTPAQSIQRRTVEWSHFFLKALDNSNVILSNGPRLSFSPLSRLPSRCAVISSESVPLWREGAGRSAVFRQRR